MGKSSRRDKHPGQSQFENKCNSSFSSWKSFQSKRNMKPVYFSDPLLIPRINQYLSENKDKVYVDINEMVSELQSQYVEYGRRKRNAFKPLVEKAFSVVLQQCGISQGNSSQLSNNTGDSENSSSEVEECNISDGEGEKASSNNQILNLYNSAKVPSGGKPNQTSSNVNTELIDLSSDDENVKKKDGKNTSAIESNEKNANVMKLNNIHNKTSKESLLTLFKSDLQTGEKVNYPNITITAKRPRESSAPKSPFRVVKRRKVLQQQQQLQQQHQMCSVKKFVTFDDFGGETKVLEEVCKLILHISHPEIYRDIGISPPRGFLLHGPPGCGKTLLANAIAGELEVELIQVSAPELVGGVSGESEERIRDLFERAVESAPCVLFIDEVDAITPNRQNAQREMERRIVAQLLTCLDELNNKPNGDLVLVIGATNRPDSLDPALRRAGRFDREVCLGIPDLKAREKILKVLCSNLNLVSNFSYEDLAQNTPGFVGADLLALTREAAMVAVNRVFGALQIIRDKERKCKRMKMENNTMGDKREKSNGESMDKLGPEESNIGAAVDEGNYNHIPDDTESKQNCNKIKTTAAEKGGNKEERLNAKEGSENLSEEQNSHSNSEEHRKDIDNTKEARDSINVHSEPNESIEMSKGENGDGDDEIDVEVIVHNFQSYKPSLDTLLYWLRDSSPLTNGRLKNVRITQEDFMQAMNFVQPSAKREGFATVPDVTWDDIGSLADVREELKMSILGPVKYRKQFEQLGLSAPAGILICGPPGCGKTLLAKAVANEAGINFISVKGPELLNMYVGESERAVRRCFQRARNSAPCVIFFDELDALCPKRTDSPESGASMRVVNQLLTEMDGVEERKEVYIMAATNRPDIIDPAVLRPGRLDKILFVGLPEEEDRIDILRALTKNGSRPKLHKDVDLRQIAAKPECHGFSGADLAALVREAGIQSIKDLMTSSEGEMAEDVTVSRTHFERALKKIRPSVSPEDRKYYEYIKKKYTISNA